MMKRSIAIVLIICFSAWGAFAQDDDLKVVSTSGESYQNGSIQLDWTIGEVGAETLENNIIVTGGFHQPSFIISDLPELPDDMGAIDVFPCPASDKVNIRLELNQREKVDMLLYDFRGKLLSSAELLGDKITEQKDVSNLSDGLYTLVFLIDNKPYAQTFSVQKN